MKINAIKKLILALAALGALTVLTAAPGSAAVSRPEIAFSDVLNGVKVELESPDGGAMYYTTDGTVPTEDSELYSGGFVLDKAGTYNIRAIAVLDGQSSASAQARKTVEPCGYDIASAKADPSKVLNVANAGGGKYLVKFIGFEDYEVFYTVGHTTRPTINAANIKTSTLYVNKPTELSLLICKNGRAPELLQVRATQPAWNQDLVIKDVKAEIQNFYGGKTIKFSSETEDVQFRYMMSGRGADFNGLMLDESNTELCDGDSLRIETEGTFYIKAYATRSGYFDSDPTSLMQVDVGRCAEPIVTVEDSEVNGNWKVVSARMPDEGDDSEIYYTTDGSIPNEGSKKYTGPRTFGEEYTLKFIAIKRGNVSSGVVATSVYGSGGDPLEKPTYSRSTSPGGVSTISLASPNDAEVYYKVTKSSDRYNNNNKYQPTVEDELYTEPIVFDESGTYYIWARAYRDGKYSELFYGRITVTIVDTLAAPTITSENLPNGVKIVRLTSVAENSIYYILSDEEIPYGTEIPKTDENLYTYPITLTQSAHIAAVAVDPNGNVGDVARGYADVPGGPVTPDKVGRLSVRLIEDLDGILVSIDCEDSEADIFYVVDNQPDTLASVKDKAYSKSFRLAGGGYLHVVAARPGYEYSYYTCSVSLDEDKTADPVITATQRNESQYLVSLSCETPGALFYYTIDGTNPTEGSSELLGGEGLVPAGVTFKAIAVAPGHGPSNVVSKILISGEPNRCRNVIPEISDILGGKEIRLTSLTDGAKIYYTTNGSEPTTDSLLYDDTKKINIYSEGETVIRAIAVKSGMLDSSVSETTVELTRLAVPKAAKNSTGAVLLVAVTPVTDTDGNMVIPTIYYTVDGSIPNIRSSSTHSVTPTIEHSQYPGSKCAQITLSENGIFYAVAAGPGYVTSYLYQTTINITDSVALPSAQELVRTPVMGGEMLEIISPTPGATLYYSLEAGAVGNINPNKIYTGPLLLTSQMNYVTVLGTKAGLGNNKLQYTISLPRALAPVADQENNSALEPGSLVSLSAPSVTVGGEETEASIFYTLDGSIPTVNSQLYTDPIEINGDMRIRAVAAAEGAVASEVLELHYTVAGETPALTIDASGLNVENGLISGSVTVEAEGVSLAGKRVMAAIYCDDMLIQAVSAFPEEDLEKVELSGFMKTVQSDSSVVVKAFVFENDGSLIPICRNGVYIK